MSLTKSTAAAIDRRTKDDPDFAAGVDEELQALRIEQELVALRNARDTVTFSKRAASWDGAEDRLPVVTLGKYLRFDQRDLRDYIDAERGASRMRRRRR